MTLQDGTASPAQPRRPVRLVVRDDRARRRLTVLLRVILAIPHFIWLALWSIAAFALATANWLSALVIGRSPAALHLMLSAYVRYVTHFYAYLFLAADPYPQFDGRPGYPIDIEIDRPPRQSRPKVLFRLLLAIPAAFLANALFGTPSVRTGNNANWSFTLGGLAHVAAILGWFACLATARMPRGLRDTVAWGIGYTAQLWAYLVVLTDEYPSCDPDMLGELPDRGDDPVALAVRDEQRRSRLTTFFRLPLWFPHLAWLLLWSLLAIPAAFANWIVTLLAGCPPAALHRFLSTYLRYLTHAFAFITLAANPFPGFAGAAGSYPVEAQIAPPRRQNRWTVGFRLILIVPAWLIAAGFASLLWIGAILAWFAALITGRMPRQLRHAEAQALRCIVQVHAYLFVLHDAYPYLGPCRLPGFGGGSSPGPPAEPHAASAAFG